MCRSFLNFLMKLFDLAPGQDIFGCAYLDPSFIMIFPPILFSYSPMKAIFFTCHSLTNVLEGLEKKNYIHSKSTV